MTSTWTRPLVFLCALLALTSTAFAVGGTPASCRPAALACAGADVPVWAMIMMGLVLLGGIALVIYAFLRRRSEEANVKGRRDASQN